jgi:hypothetical protein
MGRAGLSRAIDVLSLIVYIVTPVMMGVTLAIALKQTGLRVDDGQFTLI